MSEAEEFRHHHTWAREPYERNDSYYSKSPQMPRMTLCRERPKSSPSPPLSHPAPCFGSEPEMQGYYLSKSPRNHSDAYLLTILGGNRNPSIPQHAAAQSLPPIQTADHDRIDECRRESNRPGSSSRCAEPRFHAQDRAPISPHGALAHLGHLAKNALQQVAAVEPPVRQDSSLAADIANSTRQLAIKDDRPALAKPVAPIQSKYPAYASTGNLSPPSSLSPRSTGLPPISTGSSDYNNSQTLPSIRTTLADINLSPAEQVPVKQTPPSFSSPLSRPHLPPISGSHGSPPISPPETYNSSPRKLPASGSLVSLAHRHSHPKDSTTNIGPGVEPSDITRSSVPPSRHSPPMNRGSTSDPPISQPGGYVCTFDGCTAAPFATQYLLNSHANVHSSARPHYCPVPGCSRSEGGKGFKRKNEMIRHGLVHDSPGYVCPFCPDRDHRYPRPDNLQRHVRVHHGDKNKDDPLLRKVLAQRADGPNRGRRRRGGPL